MSKPRTLATLLLATLGLAIPAAASATTPPPRVSLVGAAVGIPGRILIAGYASTGGHAVAGVRVTLQEVTGGQWVAVTSGVTGRDGTVALTAPAPAGTDVARLAGDGGTSVAWTLHVPPAGDLPVRAF